MADEHSQEAEVSFEDMIVGRAKQWAEEYDEANLPRIEQAVTLTMRGRGDYFGYFYNRGGLNTRWRTFPGKGMVTYPVIGRSMRSKTATSVSTKVQIEIEPVRDIPEKHAGAEIARNIGKFERERQWTKQRDAVLTEMAQIHRFAFIQSRYIPQGGTIIEIPEREPKETKNGDTVYTCQSCGWQTNPDELQIPDIADEFRDKDLAEQEAEDTPTEVVDMTMEGGMSSAPPRETDGEDAVIEDEGPEAEPMESVQEGQELSIEDAFDDDGETAMILEHVGGLICPNCGGNTLMLENRAKTEIVDSLTGRMLKKETGELLVTEISPLLIRFDTYSSIGFNYKNASWFNYHPLVPLYEIITMAPHLREHFDSAGMGNWSEPARWHYDLNETTSTAQGTAYKGKNYRLDELVELNCWWISPRACVGWREPEGWALNTYKQTENGEWIETGEPQFTIAAGETLEDAYVRQFGSFKGCLVLIAADKVIGIGNQFFTEEWSGMPWKIDAQSAYPQGEEQLIKLQDAATNILGLVYSHTRRRATSTLVVDAFGGFDMDSVMNAGQPGHIIKRTHHLDTTAETNWRNYIGYLEPGDLSSHIYNFIQLIIDIAKEESGVFNETVGNVEQNNETLGGREMALTQSLGLMAPTMQAKALALRETIYIWLELWQKNAPDEAFELIKGTFEEEWKSQDIEAFRSLDVRRELFVMIVEGTDIPRTQRELEQRFFTAVQLQLFTEPNPLPIQVRSHIIKAVLGIDMDIANYSANKRLAARRYDVVKEELEVLTPNEAITVAPDAMGNPMQTLRPEILASLLQDPRTKPRASDDHLVLIEFFTDQINGLAGAEQPNEVLILACETMISAHRAFSAQAAVQMNAVQGIADGTASAMGGAAGPPPEPEGGSPMDETNSGVM